MPKLTRHLTITGRVQGVGYRWSLRNEARKLGLVGWVRNRDDGSVEAWLHGEDSAIETLTAWAFQGPPSARVDNVCCQDEPNPDHLTLTGFEQRPSF